MTLSGRQRVWFALAALSGPLAIGCSGPDDPPDVPAEPGTPDRDLVQSVSFPGASRGISLNIPVGEPTLLSVNVQPPGIHEVRFALIGDARDAVLSDGVVMSNETGTAETTLTVFSAASNFGVRAAAGAREDILNVVPLAENGATLIVEPQYPGKRQINEWVASIHVGRTCSEIATFPLLDGSHLSRDSFDAGAVRLERVEAATELAVVIRAQQFAGGCRNIRSLRANAETLVDVDVTDRPLQVADLALSMEFSVEATEQLNPALDELAFRAVLPVPGGASDDLTGLLDAMSDRLENTPDPNDEVAFEAARTQNDWRGLLVAALPPEMPGSGLRTMLHGWMRAGLRRLSQDGALRGFLGAPDAQGAASLVLSSVTGLTPEQAGFREQNVATISTEADDVVRVGVTLDFRPSPLLAAVASSAALLESPESSISNVMAERFGCTELATVLAEAGSDGDAYPGCGEGCMLSLCLQAMTDIWLRVVNSNLPSVAWEIGGRSDVTIDPDARPVNIQGTWLGSLAVPDFGDGPTQIQGALRGAR